MEPIPRARHRDCSQSGRPCSSIGPIQRQTGDGQFEPTVQGVCTRQEFCPAVFFSLTLVIPGGSNAHGPRR